MKRPASKYFPSTAPGKTWQITSMKRHSGAVAACAVEGESATVNGWATFTFVMFKARQVWADLGATRATAKALAEAEAALIAKMHEQGLIAA